MASMHTIRRCFVHTLVLSFLLNVMLVQGWHNEDDANESISMPAHWDTSRTQPGLPAIIPLERATEDKEGELDGQLREYFHRASRLPPRIRKHVTRSQVAKMRCFFNPISC